VRAGSRAQQPHSTPELGGSTRLARRSSRLAHPPPDAYYRSRRQSVGRPLAARVPPVRFYHPSARLRAPCGPVRPRVRFGAAIGPGPPPAPHPRPCPYLSARDGLVPGSGINPSRTRPSAAAGGWLRLGPARHAQALRCRRHPGCNETGAECLRSVTPNVPWRAGCPPWAHSPVGIEGLEHRTAWSFCRNRRTNESRGRAGRHALLDEVTARLVGQQSEKRSDAAAHPAGLSDVVPARRHQVPPLVIAEYMAPTRPTATDFGVTALFSPWLGFLILLIY
jgi:hypothetical protein